jgi:hypothetical protein
MLLAVVCLLCAAYSTTAQDQMYWIHIDHVKPAMQVEYEKVAKEFADACKTHKIPDFEFNTWRHNNGDYVYSSPLKNFADMDKDGMKPLRDKMGKDKFQAMFDRFDKCYDSHQSFMVTHKNDLSYMPNGKLNEGDFRKYHFFYVAPSKSKAAAEKLKEIKELFAKKGSKEYYMILHSGFGAQEEYYLAIVAAKNEMDYEKTSTTNNEVLGDEWGKKWNEFYALMTKYKTESSMYRADLSYSAKQ